MQRADPIIAHCTQAPTCRPYHDDACLLDFPCSKTPSEDGNTYIRGLVYRCGELQSSQLVAYTSFHKLRAEQHFVVTSKDSNVRPRIPDMDISKLLQLQTAVAHQGFPPRPQPQPTQDPVSSRSSSEASSSGRSTPSSVSSSSSILHTNISSWVRCSRCQRSLSVDASNASTSAVQYSTNCYYCNRCAQMVGFRR